MQAGETVLRRKPCKECKELFMPRFSTIEPVCSPLCAIAYNKTRDGKKATDKAYRADKREQMEKIKTKSQCLKEAQRVFNKWIRTVRDRDRPCITCNKPDFSGGSGNQWDAGHCKTRGGHPELRFEPTNVHKQCKSCNNPGPTKADKVREWYAVNIKTRISADELRRLEGPHPPKHYTIDDIKAIKKKYQELNRQALN